MKENKKEFRKKGYTVIKNFFLKKDIQKILSELSSIKNKKNDKSFYFERIKKKI